ncbi:hypothetical protein [Paenibacillus lautus]|uniref:hypothetical protein n=1 Tax=Paenibacillus lautus TaxID=1401 RepID=UPI001C7DE807|nr:hypothetical protein [Paenibacillus lautus]MBX4152424.1 hypothetical protein [Paenibacillus lautus]
MKFKGDIIITDPCYIIRAKHHGTVPLTENDWQTCEYGENMEALGINNYLSSDTLYGDWSCTTINSDNGESIGGFCADAGMVAVFLLDEVLKYNPDFDYHINKPWTTTLIKDFDGEIEIKIVNVEYRNEDGEVEYEDEVRVIGTGNVNFFTTQSGF